MCAESGVFSVIAARILHKTASKSVPGAFPSDARASLGRLPLRLSAGRLRPSRAARAFRRKALPSPPSEACHHFPPYPTANPLPPPRGFLPRFSPVFFSLHFPPFPAHSAPHSSRLPQVSARRSILSQKTPVNRAHNTASILPPRFPSYPVLLGAFRPALPACRNARQILIRPARAACRKVGLRRDAVL